MRQLFLQHGCNIPWQDQSVGDGPIDILITYDRNVRARRELADLQRRGVRNVGDGVAVEAAIVEKRIALGGGADSSDLAARGKDLCQVRHDRLLDSADP